jgi:hypothetical protein
MTDLVGMMRQFTSKKGRALQTWGFEKRENSLLGFGPSSRECRHGAGLGGFEAALVLLAGFCFWGVARAGFSANRRGWRPPSQPLRARAVTSL